MKDFLNGMLYALVEILLIVLVLPLFIVIIASIFLLTVVAIAIGLTGLPVYLLIKLKEILKEL